MDEFLKKEYFRLQRQMKKAGSMEEYKALKAEEKELLQGLSVDQRQLLQEEWKAAKANKPMTVAGISGTALAGIKVGTGLAQFIGGRRRLKKLKEPKYPTLLHKSPLLAQRLNQAITEGEQISPRALGLLKAQQAQTRQAQSAAARTLGPGRYGAAMQSAALGQDLAFIRGLVQLENQKHQRQQRADSLLNMSQTEDYKLHGDSVKRFQHYFNEFDKKRSRYLDQQNSGLNNLFKGLNEGAMYGTALTGSVMGRGIGTEQAPAEETGTPTGTPTGSTTSFLFDAATKARANKDVVQRAGSNTALNALGTGFDLELFESLDEAERIRLLKEWEAELLKQQERY